MSTLWTILQIVAATLLFFYLIAPIMIFGILSTFGFIAARGLANRPFYYDSSGAVVPSTFGFFTALAPGQIKIIERGEKFVRCIMKYPGHTFEGYVNKNLPTDGSKYWEVIETPPNHADAHPIIREWATWKWAILPYHFGWYWTKAFIYHWTGQVFTGIPPFQTVRIYSIEYLNKKTVDGGAFVLENNSNYSDHFRATESDFFMLIPSADTLDKVPIRLTIGLVLLIRNPWEAAYKNDQGWPTRIYSLLPSKVNDYTRNLPFDNIIAGKDTGLISTIEALGANGKKPGTTEGILMEYGMYVSQASIPDRSVVDESELSETQKRLAAVAFAKVKKDARVIEAQGEAEAIAKMTEAVAAGGENARLSMQIEGNVRVAQAAGEKAIISIGGGGDRTETLLAALVANTKGKD